MATSSKTLELGTHCPDFSLPSVDGQHYSLKSFENSKALFVMFICNHCPYVKAIEDQLLSISRMYSKADLQTIAIASNDWSTYPDDAPAELLKKWNEKQFRFPYLIDETQKVALAFDAACTPELYLFDGHRRLFYHGHIDDLKSAIDALLDGKKAPAGQRPAIGCSIKWRN